MIAATVLALSLAQGAGVQTTKLDQLAQPAPAPAATRQVVSVILDCQIASKSLTDCKAVNDVLPDATVVAEAIRMAGGVSVPAALADSGARIRVKMNVAP